MTHHHIGHRQRLKEKFLKSENMLSLHDYELVELILFNAIPRKDVKPLAKMLLGKFGNLQNIVHAERRHFLSVEGTTDTVYMQFKLMREVFNRVLQERSMKQNVINSWTSLLEYLKFNMSCLKTEQFRTLFLNSKNILIADEVMSNGTIDQTSVYPREILKRIIFHDAGAIILVHNHPSGNSKPSEADILLTKQIVDACSIIGARVHDHVIIGSNQYFSFKSHVLL